MDVKTCRVCNKSKPLTEFSKDLASKDKLNRKCKTCISKYFKSYNKTYIIPRTDQGVIRGSTDLRILLQVNQIDDNLKKHIVEARQIFKAYMYAYSKGISLKKVLEELKIDVSIPIVNNLILELKEAARQNITLEEYFRQGRLFKKKASPAKLLIAKKDNK